MELRAGYKRTEAGVIPEDWEVLPLGAFGKFKGGNGFPLKNQGHVFGDYPFFKVSDMNNAGNSLFMHYSNHWISERTRKEIGATTYPAGSIIFAKIGAAIFLERKKILARDSCIDNNVMAFVFNSAQTNRRFFHFIFLTIELGKLVSTTALPSLNGRDIAALSFGFPKAPEQRAIAAVLSDADALIASLDALIAKKRALKQAAMQQLLTRKTRLPGFKGEWEVKRLGDIAPLQRGFDLPAAQIKSGPYPVVYSNGILNSHSTYQVNGPGIVTGRSGTIGKVTFVQDDYWPHNTALWVTSFKGNDPRFIYYLYTSLAFERFATGSGVPTLNRNDVHASKVDIPTDPKEQTAISIILSDIDTNLVALESKRDKARALKQGMMQELLTGRIRLV
jgi:type I restriction enzyme, S subunit